MTDVKDFFHRFYRPDNAIISVVGNISWTRAKQLIEKWYGDICPDASDINSSNEIHLEPPQERQRRRTVRRKVPNGVIIIAFRIPEVTSNDFCICDMLSDVMANGKSSRFNRHLVEDRKLFLSVDASVTGRIDGGLLLVEGILPEGADVNVCEQAIWDELRPILTELSDERELEKLKNKFESNHYLQCSNYLQRSQNLAHYEAYGDARLIDSLVDRYCAVSASQLCDAARKYLTKKNSTVLRYLAV